MYQDFPRSIDFIKEVDPELGASMEKELSRQRGNIELIASENFVSPAVLAAMGSVLTNKYAEGYPDHRYYGGCQFVDEVENLARDRACKLFGADHANVQPHSGASANLAVFFALLQPGDTVMGMNLSEGGHLSHGSPVNISGKYFHIVPYGVSPVTETIDYDEMEKIALECKPKLIVVGASAYPASSTSRDAVRSPTRSVLTSWSTWPTSRVWSPRAFTPRRFPTPPWSPPPPTRPSAARAAA